MSTPQPNQQSLSSYYRWHAHIYDLTRWAFLFGRRKLIHLAAQLSKPTRILEIGCGTGKNLVELARVFPQASIVGLDLSLDMLNQARPKLETFGSRVQLLHQAYEAPVAPSPHGFDLIVFSYSLSMINPGYDEVIRLCKDDLRPGGIVAVVDFHSSRWPWFRQWMGVNHVRMEGQVLEGLEKHFAPLTSLTRKGYGDLWRYLLFAGQKR
ncbi:MAG TPA: class I SAM-dependent methyltransferase [Prosthecobacter sp.]